MNDKDFQEFARAFETFNNEFTALVNGCNDRLTALRRPFAVIRSIPPEAFKMPVRVILPSCPRYPRFPASKERRYGWSAVFLTVFPVAMVLQGLSKTARPGHILLTGSRSALAGLAAVLLYLSARELDIRRYNAARTRLLSEFIEEANRRIMALEEIEYKVMTVYEKRILFGAGDYYGRYFGLWFQFSAFAGDTIQNLEEKSHKRKADGKASRAIPWAVPCSGQMETLEECADNIAFAWGQTKAKLCRLEDDYRDKPREDTTFERHTGFRRRRLLDFLG